MLTHLSIRNIVLIDSCDLHFDAGLCVLTGETGAGKSILLDALGFALGAKADAGLVRHGEASGGVDAEFDLSHNDAAKAVLTELEFEAEDTLVIRRTIGADGKSRALVNDRAISATALRKIGETLVEVHGQHDQRGLMDGSTHRGLLDAFGRHEALSSQVRQAHAALKGAADALRVLEESIAQSKREEEYLRHIAGELKQLSPQAGEEEQLSEKRTRMMQSEKLFDVLNEAISELSGKSSPAQALRNAQRTLMRTTLNADGRFGNIVDALERAANDIEIAQEELEGMGRAAEYKPEELERIEERLFALKAAARKYNLPVDELAALRDQAEEKLRTIERGDKELVALQKASNEARESYLQLARALTQARMKTAKLLEKAIHAELEPLKMGSTRVQVAIEPLAESNWTANGADSVLFEAATNVTKQSTPHFSALHKIASGGELSRFMLAFKVAMSAVRSTPTLIFDEIDTGTGGAVADAIGLRLAKLSADAQVLVVTHLPQVAARGSQHLRVSKSEKKGAIRTQVEALSHEERQEELARMLAGKTITPEARKAAQKLLEEAV